MCIFIINPNIIYSFFYIYLARNIVQEEQSETGGNFFFLFMKTIKITLNITTIRKR